MNLCNYSRLQRSSDDIIIWRIAEDKYVPDAKLYQVTEPQRFITALFCSRDQHYLIDSKIHKYSIKMMEEKD